MNNKTSTPLSQTEEFSLSRRGFLEVLGSGILITVTDRLASAQGIGGSADTRLVARVHLNEDGTITALSGKVEEGQGPRTELTQAAAEELRVPVERIRLIMADTDLVPDDGITAGSRTTPANVPTMRQAAATARELLTEYAARQWQVDPSKLEVSNGVISNKSTGQSMTYADLAKSKDVGAAFAGNIKPDVVVTAVSQWKVLGQSVPKPTAQDLVTGRHQFPSDIVRPNMLYGKVLRAPTYGATLESIDLSAAQAMKDVVVVRDGGFVGFAGPTSYRAAQALEAVAKTASWKAAPRPVSHRNVHAYLKEHVDSSRARPNVTGSVENGFAAASKTVTATYTLAYIQHAPMEPRAAVAEWSADGKVTMWAGCDGPYRTRRDVAEACGVPPERVRVIIPDMGGGFGGKHSAEAAVEAARLAKAAGHPVWVRWTRNEEFTWAYCRPAAVIECKGGLDAKHSLVAWEFTNINGGPAAIGTPYDVPNTNIVSVGSDSPVPQGSYRCLAATGNNFARESFMDELAAASGLDPLTFRLNHLQNPRLRAVLQEAVDRFGWSTRVKKLTPELGVGLACGTEKNSVVAACVEVGIDRKAGELHVREVCEVFECGPVLNPAGLLSQVQGCIMMALGGALFEEIQFEDGKILNGTFTAYRVPRFRDLPKIDVHFINKTDIPSAGGGETPIIALAPAVGNAVFAATGTRLRSMPLRLAHGGTTD